MHEFSAVKNIVDRVLEISEKEGAEKISRIELGLGEFTMLEQEQMNFWLEIMLSETSVGKSTEIIFNRIEGLIRCDECGYEGHLETNELSHLFPVIQCPECGNHNVHIIEGDDLLIEKMEIEK